MRKDFPQDASSNQRSNGLRVINSLNAQEQQNQWVIDWRDRNNRSRQLLFELDQGYHYSVVVHSEEDKATFLELFLRPPETAIVSPDGGLLNNIRIDENLLLPVSYHGLLAESTEQHIVDLFGACGLNQALTHELLTRLPSELTSYQKRLAGFVRSVLMNPRVMVYDSIWSGVTKAEIEQIRRFDGIFRHYSPAHTAVYLDYDTHLNNQIHANQTFIL
jgi:predicted ABC-type transport system involved in lysophospholipase L1 biosynthesis ATPase subunit